MMYEFEIHWVALYKHESPQFLVAGPYVDYTSALDRASALTQIGPNRYVVVTQKIECRREE